MKTSLCLTAAGVFALFGVQSALADTASSAPMRHLVYSVTYGATSSMTTHNSGFSGYGGGSGSGVETTQGHNGANGTITIDVLREQPDKGVVLTVAESADNAEHRTLATTCVVYGNTTTICDPNGTVEPEAIELLRVLGSNFVDPALIDAKQHWQFSNAGSDSSTVSNFSIVHNTEGIMSIAEDRQITYTGARRGNAAGVSTISYDFNRTLPTAIHSQVTGRVQAGSDYRDVRTDVTLSLVSDSMASTKTPH